MLAVFTVLRRLAYLLSTKLLMPPSPRFSAKPNAYIDTPRPIVLLGSQAPVNSVKAPAPTEVSSGMVPSMVVRSERVPHAISGICPVVEKVEHSRFAAPGSTASMLDSVERKLLLSLGSIPVAVASTTANPAPVTPEWPQTVPGMMAAGKAGQ